MVLREATATVSVVLRLLTALIFSFGLVTLAGCGTVRDRAHDDLVDQLVHDGGLARPVAVCVVDKFFQARTTDELKKFFQRDDLTEAEAAEFARLGEECAPVDTAP